MVNWGLRPITITKGLLLCCDVVSQNSTLFSPVGTSCWSGALGYRQVLCILNGAITLLFVKGVDMLTDTQ